MAFENRHQLWLFDPDFRGPIRRIDLGRKRWHHNRGVEAMIAHGDALLLFPEGGRDWLELRGNSLARHRLANRFGSISDSVRLPDGRLLLVTRKLGLAGLAKHLVVAERGGTGHLPCARSPASGSARSTMSRRSPPSRMRAARGCG